MSLFAPSSRFIGLCLAAAFVLVPFSHAQVQKIGVVDLDYAVLNSNAGKALQKKIDAFRSKITSEGQKMTDGAISVQKELQEKGASLSADKRNELVKQLDDIRVALKRFETDKSNEGKSMQAEGLAAIEKQLGPVLEKIQKEGDFDLILNRVDGLVLVSHKRVDLTQKVIDELNKM
ncbi:OmpH family outer membrane protein [Acanthopleuribacter pedis]|uniref:OmpH family outer membrane protein n=1 Tax=Acanthopleuribacter pedis TaxID=442870 RepID=A0A8J7QA81_9BACT|nr:OmpH family outer membrane protein [Acanthopleuribacter pedis]MBO1320304.1 OmpH family outer membrane protein [Acanthopleuribacter pedis]